MPDWYDCIEPNIRATVELLRNNGINTTCSCHHTMTIEAESYEDKEVTEIAFLLLEQGWEDFRIELYVTADKYCSKSLGRALRICLPMEDGTLIESMAFLGIK